MPYVDLGHSRLPYVVVRGSSRRYTYFRFRPDSTLEVVVPRGMRVDVEGAIRAKLPWISRQSRRMGESREVLGADHVMFGGSYLRVVRGQGGEEFVPRPDRGEVEVSSPDGRQFRENVRRWFLRESSSYVVRKVSELAPAFGVRPSRVDVREIGKWGYCTRSGRLSFSWQLIALEERLREYVVLHELTHLVEFNHSARFRRKLASVCPDFRRRERELDRVVPYSRMRPF